MGSILFPAHKKILANRTRRKLRMRKRERSGIFRLEAVVREKSVLCPGQATRWQPGVLCVHTLDGA